jgi:putative ABC transport system permease protein
VRAQYEPWIGHEDLDAVTVGTKLAFTANRDLRFYGKQFRLGSLLYPTGLAYMDYGIFMPLDAIRDMIIVSKTKAVQSLTITPDEISSILVKVKKDYDAHAVAKEIEASLPGVKTIITRDLIEDVRKDVEVAIWGVMALGVLCWIMMLVLMALVFTMSVNERGRELGILRAMGATKTHVFGLIMSEALILSGTGAVVGAFVSLFAILNFKFLIAKTVGNLHFLWPSSLFILSLAIGCILSIVLSSAMTALYPAIKISLKEPYDAIHEGM